MPCFLANLSVFCIVDGLKEDLIICFNVLTLFCKEHVNIHAALNYLNRIASLNYLNLYKIIDEQRIFH